MCACVYIYIYIKCMYTHRGFKIIYMNFQISHILHYIDVVLYSYRHVPYTSVYTLAN